MPVILLVAEPFTHAMETRFLAETIGVLSTGCTIAGEALGVGVGLGVGAGLGVGIGLGVGVGFGVGIDLGVGVGLGCRSRKGIELPR